MEPIRVIPLTNTELRIIIQALAFSIGEDPKRPSDSMLFDLVGRLEKELEID